MRGQPRRADLTAGQRQRVVAFLREWLPEEALVAYREMIRVDPEGWWQDPHFAGGVIVEHALRGNGLDEHALGIADLDSIWPELLAGAVAADPAPVALDRRRTGNDR